MRIVKITLQNINSLRAKEPIVIDFGEAKFTQTGLFVITGVTGAGKSTILDAITLALYHKVPRLESGLENIVNHGSVEALAMVEFEVDGEIYEAMWGMRVLSRGKRRLKKPQETTRLKNLTTEKILAEKKRDVVRLVEQITRLSYKQFLRAVLLAQGEFSAFLSASPKDKGTLLEQITGEEIYKKIGVKLREKISSQSKVIEKLKAKINSEDLLDNREELEVRLREIEQELKGLDEIQIGIESLKSQKVEYEQKLKLLNKSIQKLQKEESKLTNLILNSQKTLTKKGEELETVKNSIEQDNNINMNSPNWIEIVDGRRAEEIKGLMEEKKRKSIERNRLKQELEEIKRKLEGFNIDNLEEEYQELKESIKKYYERERLLKRLTEIETELRTLNPKIDTKVEEKRKLEEILEHKERIYRLQLQISSLQEKRDRLKEGEECPLCGSTVHPKIEEYKKVEPSSLELEIKTLNGKIKKLDGEFKRLSKTQIEHRRDRENIERSLREIAQSIDIDAYQRREEEVRERISIYKRLKARELDILKSNLDTLIAKLERKIEKIKDEVRSRFEKQKQKNIITKTQLEGELKYLNSEIKKAKTQLITNKEEWELLEMEREAKLQEMEKLKVELELQNEPEVQANRRELLGERGSIYERFRQDSTIRERNQTVIKNIERGQIKLDNLNRLLKLLGGTVDSFNIYVQRLTLIQLIRLANIHLQKFAPRYRLQMYKYKNEKEALKFGLVDTYQADMLREIDTSSGGEKFIISLALALGLSDLASKNIKIKSLFIDEGFGTLDSKSLDTVITTLETLKREDKLIGIISHVESLKERIPTQISIIKRGNGVSGVEIS